MQGRTRIIILVVFVIIIVGLGGVFLLTQGGDDTTTSGELSQDTTPVGETPVVEDVTPTENPDPFIPVVVAVRTIPRGSKIQPGDLGIYFYPESAVGQTYFALRDPRFYRSNLTQNADGQYILIETNSDGQTVDRGLELMESVVGRLARTEIFAEQPIADALLVETVSDLADIGSDVAALIPEGLKALAIPIDKYSSVAYAVAPGDRIDIIGMFYFVELDEEFSSALPNAISLVNSVIDEEAGTLSVSVDAGDLRGRFESERIPMIDVAGGVVRQVPVDWPVIVRPSEAPRPALTVQTLVQNALVVFVGEVPEDGVLFPRVEPTPTPDAVNQAEAPQNANNQAAATPVATPVPPRPDIAIIAVSPDEANVISWIVGSGIPTQFALRSAQDTSEPVLQQVTLDYILATYNVSVPEKPLYDIEGISVREILNVIDPAALVDGN